MSFPNIAKAISVEFLASKLDAKMSLRDKMMYLISNITIEPLIFFYILPGAMGLLASSNMYLEKACRVNIGYNDSVCDAMVQRNHSGFEEYQEAAVQSLVADMLTIKTAIIGFFPTLLVLFFGSWSDRHSRRKPVILIPILCDILSGVGLYFCAYFFLELSVEYQLLFDCFPYALGGGWSCVFLGAFSYVSGLSSDKDRTIRVGAVSMFQNVAITFGNVFGGLLIGPLGYKGCYIAVVSVMFACFVYGLLVIKDKEIIEKTPVKQKSFLRDFFDIGHVKNTFQLCFKEGSGNRKSKMIVIMIATTMVLGPQYGEFSVIYLYSRIKFGWNEVDFSIFNTLQFVIQIWGSVFALSYFSKKLKLNDATLGMIALISKVSACLVYALAPTGRFFYLGCFVEVFHGTCHIALRSIMAKIVPPHELGQSNSVFGVCESLMPLLFGPFYTILYNYTIKVLPGAFYLVSAGLYLSTLPLFFWLYKQSRQEILEKSSDEKERVPAEEKPLMSLLDNSMKNQKDCKEIVKT